MSKEAQSPIVKIGTKLSRGTVVAIHRNGVDIKTPESGVLTLTFTQVEKEVL